MKILNLYAGISGNRKLWKDVLSIISRTILFIIFFIPILLYFIHKLTFAYVYECIKYKQFITPLIYYRCLYNEIHIKYYL